MGNKSTTYNQKIVIQQQAHKASVLTALLVGALNGTCIPTQNAGHIASIQKEALLSTPTNNGILVYIDQPKLSALFKRLNKLKAQASKQSFEEPNSKTLDLAELVLNILDSKNIDPDFINPVLEGGVLIEFYLNGVYQNIEIFNSSEIIHLKRKDGIRYINELNGDASSEEIKNKILQLI